MTCSRPGSSSPAGGPRSPAWACSLLRRARGRCPSPHTRSPPSLWAGRPPSLTPPRNPGPRSAPPPAGPDRPATMQDLPPSAPVLPLPERPEVPPPPRRRVSRYASLAPLVVLAVAAYVVRLPYFV